MEQNNSEAGSDSSGQEDVETIKGRMKKLKKQNKSTTSSEEDDDLYKEIQDLREDKKHLKKINENLKKRKKQLQKKVDKLKKSNKKLLDKVNERDNSSGRKGIVLPSKSELRGDIRSEKMIELEEEALVQGSLESKDDIIIAHGNRIEGNVIADQGSVKIGNSSEIEGIIMGKSVHLAEGVSSGMVAATDKIIIEKNCRISDIYSKGDLELGEDVEVCGKILYSGSLNTSRGVSVKGSLESKSEEELEEEMENISNENTPLLPIFLHVGEEKEDERAVMAEETEKRDLAEKIEELNELLMIGRDESIEVTQEKQLVNEGVSLYEEGSYDEAEEIFDECKSILEDKLEKEEEMEPSKEEVIEQFQQIEGVGRSTAEKLYSGDLRSIEEIKEASEEELSQINGIGESLSQKIKSNL